MEVGAGVPDFWPCDTANVVYLCTWYLSARVPSLLQGSKEGLTQKRFGCQGRQNINGTARVKV